MAGQKGSKGRKIGRGKKKPSNANYAAQHRDQANKKRRANALKAFKARKATDGHKPRGSLRRLKRMFTHAQGRPVSTEVQ